ncbi:unnamed protein product [Prunus armeniaca]
MEDTESEEPSKYVCSEYESSQTEGLVEGLIESRMVVHEGEREAIADWVLALPHTPEVGSSNQASPSGSVGVVVASASEGVDIQVGVPLARRNTLIEVKLANLRIDYSVPPYVGLRLPTATDVVPMMLAKLGYAPEQYNPNFWILLHGVYIAWCLIRLGEPTFEQFMYLYSISKQHWSFGWCLLGKTVTKHIPTHFQFIGSVKWGPISKEQEDEVESRPDNIAHDRLHTTRIRKKLSVFGLSLLGRVENG